MVWTVVAFTFSCSHGISQQVVEYRVESVLWQEDGRVALAYYYLT